MEDITANFFFENALVSSFESFHLRIPSKQIQENLKDSIFFSFSFDDIENLFSKFPIYNKVFRLLLQKRFVEIQKKHSLFILITPQERYEYLVKLFPNIIQRIPQKYIASYIRITPVSLNMQNNE